MFGALKLNTYDFLLTQLILNRLNKLNKWEFLMTLQLILV